MSPLPICNPPLLVFIQGRCAVTLKDGTVLSIITPERDELIRSRRYTSPSFLDGFDPWPDARANATSWEVAHITPDGDSLHDHIPGWDEYRVVEDGGDWVIYNYVPIDQVLLFVQENT